MVNEQFQNESRTGGEKREMVAVIMVGMAGMVEWWHRT